MEPNLIATAIMTSLSLLALMAAFYWAYLPALTSLYRQQLFGLRRELFLLAAQGGVSFSDPAYTRLRMTINGSLRYAERITLPRLLIAGAIWGMTEQGDEVDPKTTDLIENVKDGETKDLLVQIRFRLGMTLFWHVVRASPLLWILVGVPAVCARVIVPVSGIVRRMRKRVADLAERAAESLSGPDTPATC